MLKKLLNENFLTLVLTIFLGMALGWLFYSLASKNQGKQIIYYISQNELVALEKERLTKTGKVDVDLFDGRPSQATEIISEITKEYELQGNIIVFTKDEAKGTNVISLSKKVHEETIKQLSKLKEPDNVPEVAIPLESREEAAK